MAGARKQRDYAAEYARRKARSVAATGKAPNALRYERERAQGVERKYTAERERREARAHAKGFTSAAEATRFRKATGTAPGAETPEGVEGFRKSQALARAGISASAFEKMRTANKRWAYGNGGYQSFLERIVAQQGARADYVMNRNADKIEYRMDLDQQLRNWSDERVGYIKAFYDANVNPATNYDTVTNKGREMYDGAGRRKTNRAQFDYLVTYGQFLSVTEFEVRYGGIPAAVQAPVESREDRETRRNYRVAQA